MWRSLAPTALAASRRALSTARRCYRLYVIAGEPSGDAIGAKVLRALERRRERGDPRAQKLEVRGVGGEKMMGVAGFQSLFPMRELSVMGLVELLPHILRIRRRLDDTLQDIRDFEPDVVLTIDSKGFSFRVLRALQDGERTASITRMHYVAPSVWAYRHRRHRRDFSGMANLLDSMFAILPFEEGIFNSKIDQPSDRKWCHFVGHPAVEDFFEFHGAFQPSASMKFSYHSEKLVSFDVGRDALLDLNAYEETVLANRSAIVASLLSDQLNKQEARARLNLPSDAYTICALVGSRENEVLKSFQLVVNAIENVGNELGDRSGGKKIHVVFPTVAGIEDIIRRELVQCAPGFTWSVCSDLDVRNRFEYFQSADVAIAVSGTVVMETALANLPTIVIYRANKLTEWIAKQLAAVRFVSLPNLLLGRELLPELLFSECTTSNLTQALRTMQKEGAHARTAELSVIISTLAQWRENSDHDTQSGGQTKASIRPVRGSDIVADHILEAFEKKSM